MSDWRIVINGEGLVRPLGPSQLSAPVSAPPTLMMWYSCSSRGSVLSFHDRGHPPAHREVRTECSMSGNQRREMELPGSLATKLINFSQMWREMEAEHIAGDSFLNSSSWSLPGHSLGYGAPSVSTFSVRATSSASHPPLCTP